MNIVKILKVLKPVTSLASSVGVGAVVGHAVKAVVPNDLTKLQKIYAGVGGFFLTGFVADAVSTQLEKQFDSLIEVFEPTKSKQELLDSAFIKLSPAELAAVSWAIEGKVVDQTEKGSPEKDEEDK